MKQVREERGEKIKANKLLFPILSKNDISLKSAIALFREGKKTFFLL